MPKHQEEGIDYDVNNYTVFTSNGGHSAKAPGASALGYKEHEQTRLCNKAFIKAMNSHGHKVTDTTSDAKNKLAVLQEQVAKANKVNGGKEQIDLSFHLNASNGEGHGVEVYYYSEDAKVTASLVSSAIATTLGVKNRGAKQSKELYFLAHTKATALLIEVCFIDNWDDMQKLTSKRDAAMEAVAEVLAGPFFSSTTSSTVSTGPHEPEVPATPKSDYTGPSLVDYLKSLKIDASFTNRARLAVSYRVVSQPAHYHGTAAQNTQLLDAMRKAAK